MKTSIAIITSAWLLAGVASYAAPWPDADASEKKSAKSVEKEEELYDRGTDALDDQDWRRAAAAFSRVAEMQLSHADAALYWLAVAQSKMGNRSEAVATILSLQKQYPKSKWNEDAKALELEIRQKSGEAIAPEQVPDTELKLMAINGLMQSDPDRAIPILEHLLNTSTSTKIKDRALFVLSQSDSPRAAEILGRIAKSGRSDLQLRAIRYLGIGGGERNRQLLADIYASSPDTEVRKSVLRAYMVSGDKGRILSLAKGESNPELRSEAVTQLGVMGARNELSELYSTESSVDVRKKIIQAMFIGGSADKLADIARNEPVLELKVAAIRNLGLLGGGRSGQLLSTLYETDTRPEIRRVVIDAFFIQGNAHALVDMARRESNPDMKKRIIEKLSIMNSKEAADYLMEYLKD